MSRFPKLLTGLFRDFRNSYNAGVDLIEKDIDKSISDSAKAATDASSALTKATAAEAKADSVQDQLDQVVINGDSSPAIAQALAGTPYNTLREKLDATDSDLAQKATKTDLNEKRDKSILINEYDISDTLKQQINGNAPISQTIGAGTVTPLKTSFIKRGSQLFNKDSVISDMYVKLENGTLSANASYVASDFIPVNGGVTYHKNDDIPHFAWYDSQFTYISGGTNGLVPQKIITAPPNAKYLRISVNKNVLNTTMLNEGSAGLSYENYSETISEKFIKEIPASKVVGLLSKEKVDFVSLGKNLFNKDTAIIDKYIDHVDGTLRDNTNYYASDWILVKPSMQYVSNKYTRMLAFYDLNKGYISGIENADINAPFTAPLNASYVRVTVNKVDLNSYQLEKGGTFTNFEPFGYYLNGVNAPIDKGDEFLLFLPSEICIAVGRTIELYNSQVCWTGNLNNYHFKWACNVGKAMKRKWSCTGVTEKVGSHTLTCTVYDNNMVQVANASTTVKIVANNIAAAKKILPIGDSLTNGKPWLGELRTLSNNQLSFVGTRWNGDVQGGFKNHEGRSGWSANNYLTNSSYTFESNGVDSNNPFWNPSATKFDFAYYKTTYGINPDVVQIYLGTNGISLDPTTNVNNIKAIVDGIRSTDPNMQIYVVFTLYRGDQNGIGNQLSSDGYSAGSGVWKLEEDRKVYNLMVKLNDALKNYTNLYFIPISLTHDSENNFKSNAATPVNPRSSITEIVDAEATHPSPRADGYYQMADIMFSTYAAHLS